MSDIQQLQNFESVLIAACAVTGLVLLVSVVLLWSAIRDVLSDS